MPSSPRSAHPPPQIVTDTGLLTAICTRLRQEPFVTVDTEFVRERTYWPELCLVQLGGERETAVIDALAPDIDLTPLQHLLADASVMKVFHAARQDVEIFVERFGETPVPMFDTQVAAMVAGFGEQVGYDNLILGLTGRTVDKVHRFSDWTVRPLSSAQIAYAAADVTHLRDAYRLLRDRLDKEGRLSWVGEEMAGLHDANTYRVDPDSAWERLRPRSNNRRLLGQVRALAAWREREAQRVNIPRQRLLRDEALMEIAATAPASADELTRVRGISKGFAEGKVGQALLQVVEETAAMPDTELPAAPTHNRDQPRPSAALVALLKVILAAKCEEHHVAAKLVATSDDIDRLAIEENPGIPALHGWRREVFGNAALALKRGEVAVGVDGRRVKLIPVEADR